MSCKTGFFALELDYGAQEWLSQVADYIQQDTITAMDVTVDSSSSPNNNIGFAATPLDRLHMTLVFCGEGLLKLSSDELSKVHAEMDQAVRRYPPQEVNRMLELTGFDLFPPTKCNLLVAKFTAPPMLQALRRELWQILLAAGGKQGTCAMTDDSEWIPHVTLGKFKASSTQIGLLKCSGLKDRFMRSSVVSDRDGKDDRVNVDDGVPVKGISLRGERPKRIWLDWDWDFELP
mmetsp:Transcript_9601/g.11155  ORF Transcript_9601/g.11155 Transcript_9601/m.11155 type:complete len:233 (+) Transcript_9601:343-1041(+)|eukprot:CAMPEP_0197849206 /NCGR_PEP_ID=MMETSP1438-20131217/11257_1 /TAXON_ID=1461541 /ORGANISM="Pterosperma sp., Strain CCMP1384" /LENGTH=232 /DNA_ID=CAMNT_0043461781 /DNA_START=342 /DNA_END=1040 /DNA_ORIENTATION=+